MELNKCKRCGAFFVSNNCVCPNCEPKDVIELSKLKGFLSKNDCPNSIDTLASNTGISAKNLNRFLAHEDFSDVSSKLCLGTEQKNNLKINI